LETNEPDDPDDWLQISESEFEAQLRKAMAPGDPPPPADISLPSSSPLASFTPAGISAATAGTAAPTTTDKGGTGPQRADPTVPQRANLTVAGGGTGGGERRTGGPTKGVSWDVTDKGGTVPQRDNPTVAGGGTEGGEQGTGGPTKGVSWDLPGDVSRDAGASGVNAGASGVNAGVSGVNTPNDVPGECPRGGAAGAEAPAGAAARGTAETAAETGAGARAAAARGAAKEAATASALGEVVSGVRQFLSTSAGAEGAEMVRERETQVTFIFVYIHIYTYI